MMREEFEQRTCFLPSQTLYTIIEKHYMNFHGDKDTFCRAYRENTNGLAEKIQREADMQDINARRDAEKAVRDYEARITELEKALEHEQEWTAYEYPQNVQQSDYEKLAAGAENERFSRYMTDAEAVAWICNEFDFSPDKITIIHEVDEYEVNRHGRLRRTGRRMDRRPVYCAADYHYIRFNTSHWYYEIWNGSIRPFYD